MIRAIVTDIEGTTSSLSFVKEVLFPYARNHMQQFVHDHATEPEVATLLDEVCREAGITNDLDAIANQLVQWIDEDRKVTPLKALQGLIWETGYRNGDFHGHVYEDAVRKLREWHGWGLHLYVYSSGSVQAQQLLFAHTDYGDLTPLFSGYFDTHIGHKRDVASYATIQRELGISPSEILFLSDIKEELDAARDVGMRTCWLVRDGQPSSQAEHTQVASFDQILLQ
jgi:enolase-phosphatase E1